MIEVAVVTGVALVGIGAVVLLLRRSLIAVAMGGQMAALGAALAVGARGAVDVAAVIVVAARASAVVVTAAAVAVHRRRGADHVDELRELRG